MIKNYKILISNSVRISLEKQAKYIASEQQNPIEATKWLGGIINAIQSPSTLPERCGIAPEDSQIKQNTKIIIRHLIYKKSFRVIFTIIKNEVRILSVKHSARSS